MIDSNSIVAIAIFLATQTIALVYFAGTVRTSLDSHEKRLDILESEQRNCPLRFPSPQQKLVERKVTP